MGFKGVTFSKKKKIGCYHDLSALMSALFINETHFFLFLFY